MEAAAPDLCSVLSESQRIINSHSRHFLALSVLFLLPISFSLPVYQAIQNFLSQCSPLNSKILLAHNLSFHQSILLITSKTFILSLLFSLFVVLFSLLATGSIAYSVIHGFYGRPVKLLSSIKSAGTCFFPLLITVSFIEIILFGIIFLVGFLVFLVINGFEVIVSSPYSSYVLFGILGIVLLLIFVYLQLNWVLSGVIVVAESSWGLQPLRRSSFLIKGMKGVALSMLLFFGFLFGLLMIASSFAWGGLDIGNINNNSWKIWPLVVRIVVTSALGMILLLYNGAAFTVLYMNCKAAQGELVWEIAEEFAGDYVSLPFDHGKTPHFISVAYSG